MSDSERYWYLPVFLIDIYFLYIIFPDKCFCMVGGDPLYITFDGQLINYQGSCSYLLSKSTVPGNLCEFQIHIKNKLFADRPRIVMPEKVHLEIYGHSYYISKNETYVWITTYSLITCFTNDASGQFIVLFYKGCFKKFDIILDVQCFRKIYFV